MIRDSYLVERLLVPTFRPAAQSTSVPPALLRACSRYGPIPDIYDCGSRDALDGIDLLRRVGARSLHVFECNPPSASTCRRNATDYKGTATIVVNELAVSDTTGPVTFHPVDTEKTVTRFADGNPGASSLFLANPDYPHEKFVQGTITVSSTTLDAYATHHPRPALLWLDLQGAELMALRGAQGVLDNVRVIFTEVSLRPVYLDQPLLWDIDAFLRSRFKRVDLLLGRWPPFPSLYRRLRTGPWTGDAIYVNRTLLG